MRDLTLILHQSYSDQHSLMTASLQMNVIILAEFLKTECLLDQFRFRNRTVTKEFNNFSAQILELGDLGKQNGSRS